METGNLLDIRALASLLKENSDDGGSDTEDKDTNRFQTLHPGVIGPASPQPNHQTPLVVSPKQSSGTEPKRNGSIWSPREIEGSEGILKIPDISNDPRKRPEVEVQFKQEVATEDVYLGTFSTTPGSASCPWLIVKIKMPGETDSSKIQLDLKDNWIELRSQIYALVYVLPSTINPRLGNAKWNRDTTTLTLTLKIVRDLDSFNNGLI